MVKPAARRSWRDRETVQFGVAPGWTTVVGEVDREAAPLLDLLDGTRGPERIRREAEWRGVAPERVAGLLRTLRARGVLDDAAAAGPLAALPEAERERLRPDLASLSLVHPAPGAAAARLVRRGRAGVLVRGAGRVGASVAAVLAAAGIGRVEAADGGGVEPWDTAPCGTPAAERGRPRADAVRWAVRAAAPARAARSGTGVDLVVLAPRDGLAAHCPDPRESRALVEAGVPHLYTGVLDGMGFVGPLVVPGAEGSACGECLTLRLVDADPALPRVLAQLRSGRPGPVPACDVALATAVAGLAAVHALMFLDGGVPASFAGRVEVSLADTRTTVRPVPPHPECGGAWQAGSGCATVGHAPAAARDAQVTMGVD
ncbi:ThiF family adenylyltransferase [Streptomyces capparidis]